jgi:hypothetical protein
MPSLDRFPAAPRSRRALLRAGAAACPVALAGCSLFAESERHYVDVYNVRKSEHRVEVFVWGPEEQLFEESYTLEPDHGTEGQSFEGTPAEVAVRVDDERVATFEWRPDTNQQFLELHPDGCSSATSATLKVYLTPPGEYDDTGLDASTERCVYWTYGCETVTD